VIEHIDSIVSLSASLRYIVSWWNYLRSLAFSDWPSIQNSHTAEDVVLLIILSFIVAGIYVTTHDRSLPIRVLRFVLGKGAVGKVVQLGRSDLWSVAFVVLAYICIDYIIYETSEEDSVVNAVGFIITPFLCLSMWHGFVTKGEVKGPLNFMHRMFVGIAVLPYILIGIAAWVVASARRPVLVASGAIVMVLVLNAAFLAFGDPVLRWFQHLPQPPATPSP
jgi:hypothetical protein